MKKVIKGIAILFFALSIITAAMTKLTGIDFKSMLNKETVMAVTKEMAQQTQEELSDAAGTMNSDWLTPDLTSDILPDTSDILPDIEMKDLTSDTSDAPTREAVFVERVVDGDTFVIEGNQKVRLIGINTPESVASEEYLEATGKENTSEGKEASNFTKSLIEGQTVYLEFDAGREDKYGRLLAYVFLEDGEMLQDILLRNGYAELMTIQPNVKYADHFVEVISQTR